MRAVRIRKLKPHCKMKRSEAVQSSSPATMMHVTPAFNTMNPPTVASTRFLYLAPSDMV